MYAVGRLGSYITRGVNTVSGPFHPFGGAVDIVVVEQQDGSFKSSPWYVRFGKFQGVLKAKEKVVNISVDGVEANLHMYLDNKGVAYFLREVDAEEVDSILLPSSSGEESDGRSGDRKPVKSKSCNYDVDHSNSVTQIDVISGKVVARTSSSRSRIMGVVLGRKSMKEDRLLVEKGGNVGRVDSLERAEIAADLLELKWSTNISPNRHPKGISDGEARKNSKINDGESEVEMSCLSIGIPNLGESGFEGNTEMNSDMLREINKIGVTNVDHDANAKILKSDIACPDSQIQDSGVSKEENELDRFQPFIHLDTSDSSKIGSDVFSEQANETPHLCCGNCEEVCAHAETLHETTELISEVNSQPETGMLVAKGTSNVHEFLGDKNCCNNSFSDPKILESERIFANANSIVTEAYAGSVNVLPVNGSAKEVESYSIVNISSFSNSNCVVKDEKNTREEDEMNMLHPSLERGCDSREITGDFVMSEAINISPPEDTEEEQFLFSDLDDFKLGEVKPMESFSLDHVEKGNCSSLPSKGMEAVNESSSSKFESDSSPDFIRENLPNDVEELRQTSKIISSHINIPRKNEVTAQEVGHMVESLPIMLSHSDELDEHHLHHFVSHSLDSNSKSSKWMLIRKDVLSCKKSYGVEEHPSSNSQPTVEDAQISEELNNVPDRPAVGDPSKIIDSSNGSWRLWPFKGSRNTKVVEPALIYSRDFNAENALESTSGVDVEKDVPNPKAYKKKIRAITPTSEQLASLNLKEGRNTVTFTFSTSVLGKQQVDAIIYLWRWDTRIVISDVDGTITKSDLLGQFMPLVGKDWSQTGVAHFFSAIKENGYQMLFLSARSISQAYHTRQFLFNLKQDGKSLPDGPVVISPDGLFPSLFREVIRRAPHEFKIGCLEDIRALFPSDRNPFYAGFGNRDTDEFSYLKVGIPKGKIFIINPKGEVVVNRRVDSKSYTELQALVNSMFPPIQSEQEDFNTWNYWKLPLPSIDM